MLNKKIKIINKLGLHARASMKLVNLATRFESDIILIFHGREVNAKSIMNVMVLGVSCGSQIELRVSGKDEHDALAALVELINNRFDESE